MYVASTLIPLIKVTITIKHLNEIRMKQRKPQLVSEGLHQLIGAHERECISKLNLIIGFAATAAHYDAQFSLSS